MTYHQSVVSRFTRSDGNVAWQAVANALGCTVEKAKIEYGPIKKAEPAEILARPVMRRR